MISVLLILLFLVFMFMRVPVSIAITLATIIGMLVGGYDLLSLPQHMAASTQSIPLMAIPFFILAANLMNALGITRQIFDFADALVGCLRGGLAHANVVAGAIFSGISGAAVADAAALGAISMKEMPKAGYSRAYSAATVIAASTLGPIIPPSIMMVIYAITANVSVARLFLAGVLPGLLIVVILMATIHILTRSGAMVCPAPTPFSLRRVGRTGRDAILALLAPLVILRSMSTGIVTPTEAGILAVVYALGVGIVQRHFPVRAVIAVLRETVEGTALIMYIIAVSSALSWVFVAEGTGKLLTEQLLGLTDSPLMFLLIVNLLLLVIGCLIETLPAMLITVPILLPTAKTLGIDLVHFGVIVIFNLIIGIMTPPMGIGLYILMAISEVKFGELVRASLPFVAALLVALVLLTMFPQITLLLPDLLMPEPGARR